MRQRRPSSQTKKGAATSQVAKAAIRGRWTTIIVATIGLVFLVALAVPFRPVAEASVGYLDYSWMRFLNEAFAAGRQFGKEVIYTYGPLGFIATSVYDPRTFVLLLFCRILLAVGVFAVVWESTRGYFSRPLLALPWLLAIAALMAESPDHFFPVCSVLLLWTYFVVHDRKITRSTCILIFILAAAGLMKVNFLMQSLLAIGAIAVDRFIIGGRWRVAVPAIYALCLAAFYLSAGQSPASAGAFIRSWAIVSGGYIEAVALRAPAMDAVLYLIVAVATLLMAADLHWRRRRLAGIIPVAALAGILALLFKHSFVRQDFVHAAIAPMVVLAIALLYLPAYWQSSGARRRYGAAAVVAMATVVASSILTGYKSENLASWAAARFPRAADSLSAAIADAAHPGRLSAERDIAQAQLRRDNNVPLPAVRGTVDIYPTRLDVLFAYHFPYAPRPAVQSIIAMAPPFARLDAEHLLSSTAAETVLFDIDSIDDNYLSLLDGLSWPNLLTRYDIVDTTGAFLVLRRSDHPRKYRLIPLETLAGQFDVPIVLPQTGGGPLWATFHFKKRLAGKLISALYKPPTMAIIVHTADGNDDASRLIPSLAEGGFLLSPLMKDRTPGDGQRKNRLSFAHLAARSWREDLAGGFVQSATISINDAVASTYFDPRFSIEIDRLEFARQEAPISFR